jgi:type IV secretory pathway protease TraF
VIVTVIRDALYLIAIGSIAVGLWWIHPAASLVGTGGIVLAGLVLLRR